MNDIKFKAKLKKILVITNITLSVILFALLISWLLVLRPVQFTIATTQEQYASFDLDNLPDFKNTIQADYFGKDIAEASGDVDHSQGYDDSDIAVSDKEKDLDRSDRNHDEILDQASKLLDKSKRLTTNSSEDDSGGSINSNKHQANDEVVTGLKKISSGGRVAIIVTNLGLNKKPTEMALKLPRQCALGFLPYTKTLKPLLNQAQSEGHEIYLYLPMQTSRSYENPGKYALLGNLPVEENIMRLNVILNSHARYDGVYSSFKEVFTSNPQTSEFLFDHLEDNNLIFLMGKSFGHNIPAHLQGREKLLFSSLILDKEPDENEIKENLEKLIKMARDEGSALGYSQGYSLSIDMINEWIPTLRSRGVDLVPVSELLK